MNPVLLKPEADTRSQVVVRGVADPTITQMPWRERGPHLWPVMAEAFDRVSATADLVVIEGAGSPAEINLPDLVNNRTLDHADAEALLVVDIDRGGAFAHLYGTWSLVPDATRQRLAGFVLNKFRGDAGLLEPAPAETSRRTGMAALGVLPMLRHDLPDEEHATLRGHAPRRARPRSASSPTPTPRTSTSCTCSASCAAVHWVHDPADVDRCDLVVLPGSKHVAADHAWMVDRRLDRALIDRAAGGGRILGVCGGAMLLGRGISDPAGVEGATPGLGLLDYRTEMAATKTTRSVTIELPRLPEPWSALSGCRAEGYEIRHGRMLDADGESSELVWSRGSVLTTTVHGLLEEPTVLEALFGTKPPPVLDDTFDLLADAVDEHLDTDLLWSLVRGGR